MKLTVRRMQASDVERVAELCGQLGYPSTPAQVAARFQQLRQRPDEAIFLATAADEQVVGWVHVGQLLTLESDAVAEVFGVVVDVACRGQGVGRLLMEAAEAWAAEHGYGEIRLRSNVVREDAHRFYRGLGYEVLKTQYTFRKRAQAGERRQQ